LSANPWAYRNRIRIAFDAAGNPGYRGRRSHAVIPIAECPIAAPLLVRAARAAAGILRESSFFRRPTELSLFCDPDEDALLVSLFAAGVAKGSFQDFAALRGAELVAAGRAGQPPSAIAHWGAASLSYRAAGFDYRVDHGAFFQANRWLVDALVERVAAGRSGRLAWDLFAGVGLFARRLAAGFGRVVAVESAPAAAAAIGHNLKGVKASAVQAFTLDFLRRARLQQPAERPDLIVVDPPRTGLSAETCRLLGEIAAPALVYVSCDPATLARDLRALLGAGYVIENLALADLFPQTFHIETVAELRRGC
jgi:23S rRNA (uracil1939-C5)-methyltransferase